MDSEEIKKRIEAKFGKLEDAPIRGVAKRQLHRRPLNKNIEEKKLSAFLDSNHINQSVADITSLFLIKNDDSVISIKSPTVRASVQSKIFAISGKQEESSISSLMPSIYNKLDDEMKQRYPMTEVKDDDSIPEVDNFEAVSLVNDEEDKEVEKNENASEVEK